MLGLGAARLVRVGPPGLLGLAAAAFVPWADAGVGAGQHPGRPARGRGDGAGDEAGGRNTNNDRYVFVNVDDHQDPLGELRRLMNLQMTINHNGAVGRAMTANDFARARWCRSRSS